MTKIYNGLTIDSLKDQLLMDSIIMLAENIERLSNNETIAYSISEFEKIQDRLKIFNSKETPLYQYLPVIMQEHFPEFNQTNNILKEYWEYEIDKIRVHISAYQNTLVEISAVPYLDSVGYSQELYVMSICTEYCNPQNINELRNKINSVIQVHKNNIKILQPIIKLKYNKFINQKN